MKVQFYDEIDDASLKFAVILAQYQEQWVFVRHALRTTWEIPGGHREKGEAIERTAARELQEETGATEFKLIPLCVYSVEGKNRVNHTGEESFGMLFYAQIKTLDSELKMEIKEISFMTTLPENLTYPEIQPHLFREGILRLKEHGMWD